MNFRKQNTGLTSRELKRHLRGWQHARAIGLPLNTLVTVRPANVDAMQPQERIRQFVRVRNLYGQFARRNGFLHAYCWTRESEPPAGAGEHMHILCHVPRKLEARFMERAADWLAGAGEIDVRRATYDERWTPSGKVHSIGLYTGKQMLPPARYKRPYAWKRGGPIVGKRSGLSRCLVVPDEPGDD